MARSYFPLLFRWQEHDAWMIWFSCDDDGVLLDEQGQIVCFSALPELKVYAAANGLVLVNEEPVLHNFDIVADFVDGSTKEVECVQFLCCWNLLADIFRSTGTAFAGDTNCGDHISVLYGRLFYGSTVANEVLRPVDEPVFRPEWSVDELALLREVFGQGLLRFAEVCPSQSKQKSRAER